MLSRRQRGFLLAGLLIGLGCLLLAVVSPSDVANLGICYLLGTMYGQTTLAAAWVAFGPLPLLWRLPLSLAWVGLMTIAFWINEGMHGKPQGLVVAVVCGLIVQWIVVQVPLWSVALANGWRLVHADDLHKVLAVPQRQFGLRQLMIFTAIIAVVLAIGRMIVTQLPGLFGPFWLGERPIFIFLAVAAILMTLLLVLASLLPRRSITAVLIVLAVISLLTILEMPLSKYTHTGSGPGLLHLALINLFTVAWILAIVSVLRLNGFGLAPLAPTKPLPPADGSMD